jgi:predicted ATPase with chaperone activity
MAAITINPCSERSQSGKGDRYSDPNLLMLGSAGAGNSMLARCLTTILPDMTRDEALETPRIHRVAGLTRRRTACVTTRPCRAPTSPGPMGD